MQRYPSPCFFLYWESLNCNYKKIHKKYKSIKWLWACHYKTSINQSINQSSPATRPPATSPSPSSLQPRRQKKTKDGELPLGVGVGGGVGKKGLWHFNPPQLFPQTWTSFRIRSRYNLCKCSLYYFYYRNVIQALAEGKRSHVPFRNSTLTRLLQEGLSGNCKTRLVVSWINTITLSFMKRSKIS